MANAGAGTTGSQFFVTVSAAGAKNLGGPPYSLRPRYRDEGHRRHPKAHDVRVERRRPADDAALHVQGHDDVRRNRLVEVGRATVGKVLHRDPGAVHGGGPGADHLPAARRLAHDRGVPVEAHEHRFGRLELE